MTKLVDDEGTKEYLPCQNHQDWYLKFKIIFKHFALHFYNKKSKSVDVETPVLKIDSKVPDTFYSINWKYTEEIDDKFIGMTVYNDSFYHTKLHYDMHLSLE